MKVSETSNLGQGGGEEVCVGGRGRGSGGGGKRGDGLGGMVGT